MIFGCDCDRLKNIVDSLESTVKFLLKDMERLEKTLNLSVDIGIEKYPINHYLWYPVDKRQPPNATRVLVAYTATTPFLSEHQGARVCHYDYRKGYSFKETPGYHEEITHWMLLPELPTMDNK